MLCLTPLVVFRGGLVVAVVVGAGVNCLRVAKNPTVSVGSRLAKCVLALLAAWILPLGDHRT